jgi:hypothetical protein
VAEKLILDPAEISGRTQLDITPWVKVDGIDWGSAEIEPYRTSMSVGEGVIDYRLPNRNITVPLVIKDVGGTSFATVRSLIQAKAALFQRNGGYLKRITAAGGTLYADVQASGLTLGGGWSQAHKNYDVDAEIRLEASPDFYGPAVTLADHVETSATELVFTETDVDGDYPARVRVVVDEDQGQSQLGLIWSFRNRHYSSAATAACRFEAEALTPLDTAARAALSGASGGTVVTHGTLSTNWTPVLDMRAGGTAYPTHTGTNRLWVRYRTTSGTAVQLRAVWDVGDMVFPVENTPIRCNAGTALFDVDLGELRLDPPPVGTHRWNAILQAKGAAGGENVSIDKVWVLNADEGYGVLRAPITADAGLIAYSARDEFNQAAGALTGKTLPVGGVWTNVAGGDTDDFTVEATGHTAQRTAVSDTAPRFAQAGTTSYTNIAVETVLKGSAFPGGNMGVFARLVDASNYLTAVVSVSASTAQLVVRKVVVGVETDIASRPLLPYGTGQFYAVRLYVDDRGNWFAWYGPEGALGDPQLQSNDPVLATGGALATGKVGIYDRVQGAGAVTRNYASFGAWVPVPEAVLYASQSAELRWDGMFREDISGSAYGPVSWVTGDLPRLPPTVDGRGTTEVFVKASRGDFAALPDTAIDDISARITYYPAWLTVPGT